MGAVYLHAVADRLLNLGTAEDGPGGMLKPSETELLGQPHHAVEVLKDFSLIAQQC
jgi:hypothetical protein